MDVSAERRRVRRVACAFISVSLLFLAGCASIDVGVGAGIETGGGGHGRGRCGGGGGGGDTHVGGGIGLTFNIDNPAADTAEEPPKICGPDVTKQVLDVLNRIIDDYRAATPAQKEAACAALRPSPSLDFESAWDIDQFAPDRAPDSKTMTPEQIAARKFWFEGRAGGCCKPRDPCGPTIVFLNQCIHSQVVNYVMWGAINNLCGQSSDAAAWHLTRQVLKNQIANKNPFIDVPAAPYDEQKAMVDIGLRFTSHRQSKAQEPADPSKPTSGFVTDKGGPLPRETKDERTKELERLTERLRKLLLGSTRPEKVCQMSCKLTEGEEFGMQAPFSYSWTGLQ